MQTDDWLAIINTMGHATLIEVFKSANYYLIHSNDVPKSRVFSMNLREAKECYMFVQGTGLPILLSRLGLDYNSDRLRSTFNYCARKSV